MSYTVLNYHRVVQTTQHAVLLRFKGFRSKMFEDFWLPKSVCQNQASTKQVKIEDSYLNSLAGLELRMYIRKLNAIKK